MLKIVYHGKSCRESKKYRKEVFQILEGEEQISQKADELLNSMSKKLFIFVSEYDIANFYHSGILDKLEKISGRNIKVRLLTNYSPKSCFFLKKIRLKKTKYSMSKVEELPTFILVDDEQMLLLIRKDNGKKRVAALWTNYNAFVNALKALFLELWDNKS